MSLKRPKGAAGTLLVLEHSSRILKRNPLGDPHLRKLGVWLPPQYDAGRGGGRGGRFPVLYDLVGFTASGLAHANWKPFGDNVPERAARAWPRASTTAASSASKIYLCMAATYDPDPRAPLGFRIPFNAETGEAIEER